MDDPCGKKSKCALPGTLKLPPERGSMSNVELRPLYRDPYTAQFEREGQSTAMRRPNVCSFMANIILLCSAVFSAGCAGVCIVDVASSSVLVRRDCGTFREEPLYVMNDSFLT